MQHTPSGLPDPAYCYGDDDLFSVYAIAEIGGEVVEQHEYGDYGSVSARTPGGYARGTTRNEKIKVNEDDKCL